MKQACRDESVVFFPISNIYVSRSTLTHRALYYGKIETQSSYIYIYIYIVFTVTQQKIKLETVQWKKPRKWNIVKD